MSDLRLWVVVEEFLQYAERDLGFTRRTLYGYKWEFKKFTRWGEGRTIDQIQLDEVVDYFRAEEERGLKISSVNTSRRIIRTFFYYCQYYRKMTVQFDYKMIRNKKEPPRDIKFAEVKDVDLIVSLLETSQDKLIVLTLFQTAMRISSLVQLRAEDINGTDVRIVAKGGKNSLVCIDEDLAAALQKHMNDNKIFTGPVFRHKGGRYTVSGLRNRFIRRLEPHGVHAGFHWYRHGCATAMLRNGAGLRFVQEYLGHADIRSTQIYTHITDNDKKESFQKYFPKGINISKVLDTN